MGKKVNILEVFVIVIIDLWCGYLWYDNLFVSRPELNQMFGVIMGAILMLYSLFILFFNYTIFNRVIAD